MNIQSRFQRGLSLVELMVALAIGMVLIAGFLQIFLSVRSTYSTNEAASRTQENGRFALEFLSEHARMAGYRDPKHLDRPLPIMPPTGNGCAFSSGTKSAFCTEERGIVSSPNNGDETGDRIAFTYQPPLDSSGKRLDCAGNEVTDADGVIINTFTTRATESSSGLACRSIYDDGTTLSSGYTELVDGIDAVQFQYGLMSPTGFIHQYVTADNVPNWSDVGALRIAVLANSISTVTPPPPDKDYYLLDAGPYNFSDGKIRQVFTTTVYLRNSIQ